MANIVEILRQALALSTSDQMEIVARLAQSLRNPGNFEIATYEVSVRVDDIAQVPADALVTAVFSSGGWGVAPSPDSPPGLWSVLNPRSIDAAIHRVAGAQYHRQARMLVGAAEGATLVAARQALHHGAFEKVLFVVDDWTMPLAELVTRVLEAADAAGLASLSMPLLRTGTGATHGLTVEEKVAELVHAVKSFRPQYLQKVHLVASGPKLESRVAQLLASATPSVTVTLGDITRKPADALILGINSDGLWAGGVDRAIYASSGNQFHQQARALLGLPDGEVVVAKTLRPHDGAFDHVVFVVDNLQVPLYQILTAGLRAADLAGFGSVTIPALRMGVMRDLGGPPEEKVREMAQAVLDFQREARHVRNIDFVIYGEPVTLEALRAELCLRSGAPRDQEH